MPFEFSIISAARLESLPRERTVFFFPVGPLEDHGPHLPMGLDLEEASKMSFASAQRLEQELPDWTGVVMPSVPLGIDSNTTKLAITVRPYVLRDWLVDSCRALAKNGFCHFVCFSGHLGPRQLTAIEEAGKIVRAGSYWPRGFHLPTFSKNKRLTLISASSSLVSWKEVFASPFWSDPREHGGTRDTSVALAVAMDLVDPSFVGLPALAQESSRWSRNIKRKWGHLAGYWGDPATANGTMGEKAISEDLQKIFPKLKAVWQGEHPRSLFRTWYSILPPNKSFFKAWLMVVLICLFIAGALFFLTNH